MHLAAVFPTVATAAIAIIALVASDVGGLRSMKWAWANNDKCITRSHALQAADIYGSLIHSYSDAIALESLTEDFVDWSSAVNIIRNKGGSAPFNLTAPTFTGREAFMSGQGAQPPIEFQNLGVWHGCDSVSMRWLTTRSAEGQVSETARLPVIGNSVLELVLDRESKYGFRIKALYAEFNSAAWLVNLGVFTPAATRMDARI